MSILENKKFQTILMIGLIITMVILSIFIFQYKKQIKENPCDFCSMCNNPIIYSGEIEEKEYIYIPIEEVDSNLTELKGGN